MVQGSIFRLIFFEKVYSEKKIYGLNAFFAFAFWGFI